MSREIVHQSHGSHGGHDYDQLLDGGHALVHQPHHVPTHHGGHHPAPGHTIHVPLPTHMPHGGHPGHHAGPVEVHHHYSPPPGAPHHPHQHPHQPAPPPPMPAREEGREREWMSGRGRRGEMDLELRDGDQVREFPIGFYELQVPAFQEADIEVKPQVMFRGERLAIPIDIARNFDILDIKVGKDSQLAASGIMPGAAFATTSVDVTMQLDWAEPGIVITIRVQNNTGTPADFKAVMYGKVIDPKRRR